ncbi:8-amino-7-oxononanoate synthase [Synechococcus sp. PROS-U-1]|uniref:aminotransferase class I/II-fold pyridoxal phosphate-dependent enzyme n=1 Tax=Synechococcus sp. PROS-U-1 TaxID=1400866 RepID=UPI0016486814|nr:8-amino-7-oxononanoate synthase [Synechococcus sp. PROS-U-1]QNJ04056.1 8-amino-7-oxononanoate synthase [Synechococcus sp. PROS-U-1]
MRDHASPIPPARRRRLRSWSSGQEPWQLQDPAGRQQLLDLASNDYLGLSRHPDVLAAATEAMASDGVGAGGSRLITGTRPRHLELEEALAAWLGRDRVLLFPSGFQANIAAVTALSDRHTTVLVDRLIHHSLLTGVRTSGARLQRFAHNDLKDLDQRLQRLKAATTQPTTPPLVVTESLFSMEGTSPDLNGIADLCAHHGAQLLVDEAHGLGVLGPGGCGLCHGLQQPVALVCGTFGKAFGSGGAFLAGDHTTMERLLQTSGAFRYTTALAPPLVAAAQAALHLIQTNPTWGTELSQRSKRWRTALTKQGWAEPPGRGPVLPLLIGDDQDALDLQQRLEKAGLLSVAIRPPTVPEGTARLRLVLRRDLPDGTLEQLLTALCAR